MCDVTVLLSQRAGLLESLQQVQGDSSLLDRLTGVTSVQTTGLKRAAAQERLRSVGGKRPRRRDDGEGEEEEGAERPEDDPNVIGTEVRFCGAACAGRAALCCQSSEGRVSNDIKIAVMSCILWAIPEVGRCRLFLAEGCYPKWVYCVICVHPFYCLCVRDAKAKVFVM